MSFRINTNISAMNAHTNSMANNRNLENSLEKLSSGLRINKAADDASGMVIADSLRSQANSLGQAINNSNDAIGLIQTADKAMDEQVKILDTIKTKSIQAASDTQNADSREAIQKDVDRLLEQLDNIAKQTSFNGQKLLSGQYSNKEFQVGAFSNETITTSIQNTQSMAIGNIATMGDIAAVGNTESGTVAATASKDAKTLDLGTILSASGMAPDGLAQGDTIRINGVGDYKIEDIDGGLSSGGGLSTATVTLDRGLETSLSTGSDFEISIVQTAAEDLSGLTKTVAVTSQAGDVTLSASDVSGFAVGDKLKVTTSTGESKTYTVQQITGASAGLASGTVVLSSADTIGTTGVLSNGSISISDRASLGTDYTSDDFVQYTVNDTKFEGVQLTEEVEVEMSDGSTSTFASGVDQQGLGRAADLINSSTDKTGVKAEAVVEQNSNIKVQEGTLSDDIVINGQRILDAGTSIEAADTDNTLVNAINEASNETGVSASLEADGTLTLSSDGRAMVTDGLSGVAGINDGVHAGTLEFTKTGGGNIDVESTHYSDAGLTNENGSASSLDEIEQSNVLSDLTYGRVDDSGDGVIDDNDQIGLLLTQEGAMRTMDITESAISKLDGVRADLGSAQNQLTATVNNISVTQVNVQAAESQLRDVDFASESAQFSKFNILAQSGSYAMSQANAVQQNVMRLLQ